MLIALLVLAAPTSVARDIDGFCRSAPNCVAEQRLALKHFLGRVVMWDAPPAVEQRCMRAGKMGHAVDWMVAEACLKAWSKGRVNVFARARKGR